MVQTNSCQQKWCWCKPDLRQDQANSESIKMLGMMNTEGRLHPYCAERALTARTLSGFFIGTEAIQCSTRAATNGQRGNGIFICPSSSDSETNFNINQHEVHFIHLPKGTI